jgi:hypothetical protein
MAFGIELIEAEETESSRVVKVGRFDHVAGEGLRWHRTYEGALKRAEKIRKTKIEYLKRYIKRLEDMKFEEPKKVKKSLYEVE